MVEVAQTLLGRGFKVRIYDPALNLGALVGANKRVIDTRMPHLASLLCPDLATALGTQGLVIAAQQCALVADLKRFVTGAHHVLDVNGWPEFASCRGSTRGCAGEGTAFRPHHRGELSGPARPACRQESCTLRDAGYQVVVICPQTRGYTQPDEVVDGIQIYRHWISEEAGGFSGFIREYVTALWGETRLGWKAWRRHRFKVVHLCNPPDLLFLVALPFKVLFGVKVIYDVHDLWPEMFEAKFGRRGLLYWAVRLAERLTYAC